MTPAPSYHVTDMHTAGEPVRIFTGGLPELRGATLLHKRRDASEHHDAVRRALMLEPRGHADMYGVWPVAPDLPEAALAVLFTHNGGYSTMCGHATIALGRWMVDEGLVSRDTAASGFTLQCPCGPVRIHPTLDGTGAVTEVAFDNVPAWAAQLDAALEIEGHGAVTCDIGYGGAFYAILPASRLGLDLRQTPLETLIEAGRRIVAAGRGQLSIRHPEHADLAFLYGAILTDDVGPESEETAGNLCVFGNGQVDRSATGSGVTARLAVDHARGLLPLGGRRRIRGLSGLPFDATLVEKTGAGVTVRVSGRAFYTGRATFTCEADDPLREGFEMAPSLGGIWH